MQMFMKTLTIIIPLTVIMGTFFTWLRQDIKAQCEHIDKRIDEQGKDIRTLIADVAALATILGTQHLIPIY